MPDGIEFAKKEVDIIEFIRHSKHYHRRWYEWIEWTRLNKN